MKDQLIFDTTDANTIADSDSVGAYLRASDGTLLTHTDVGGKKALDVRVAEGINVEVDLNFADDSVTAHQGGTWTIDSITNAVTVQATDLDIRDLTQADEITVFQGTSPWVVSATDLDIRDLSAASDSVQSNLFDGAGNAISSTAGALDVYVTGSQPLTINDAALANTAIASGATSLSVANTAQDVVASPLSNRKYLYMYNNDNQKMFIGQSGVSAANGFPVSPGSYIELRAGASVDIEYVSAKASHDLRYMELS